jgi:DNA-binding transcriptional LysR family regulator
MPTPQSSALGSFVAAAFRAGNATVVATAHELGINLARTGRYLTILPQFLLQFPSRHPFIKQLPIELPIASAPIGIIMLRNRAPSPVLRRFIDCAREFAKPLARQRR